jgi:hypothetical protein
MPESLGVRVVSRDLARLAVMAKAAAPELRRQIPKRLREAAEPVKADAERRKPSQRITIGLRTSLPAARGANVKITARSPSDPPLAGLLELGSQGSGGRYIRHPVYGRPPYVNQPTKPYLKPAIEAHKAEATRRMAALSGDVARALRIR